MTFIVELHAVPSLYNKEYRVISVHFEFESESADAGDGAGR